MSGRSKKADTFGLSMKQYCKAHETYVLSHLSAGDELNTLLTFHERKIVWLQHERLIHLIVTLLISLLLFFSIGLFLVLSSIFSLLLIAIVLVLLIAYICHYFFLENRVQYWYTIYDRIYHQIQS